MSEGEWHRVDKLVNSIGAKRVIEIVRSVSSGPSYRLAAVEAFRSKAKETSINYGGLSYDSTGWTDFIATEVGANHFGACRIEDMSRTINENIMQLSNFGLVVERGEELRKELSRVAGEIFFAGERKLQR
jgi:hypothetical protein